MSEGLLKPEVKQPPETAESGGREDEGDGVEDVITKDKASLSISPPSASLPYLASPRNPAKKGTGRRKRKPLKERLREAAEHRLERLNESFLPVPFTPRKALDISAHEELFHALGLWKFSRLDLGRELRPDLLAHLIAYYDPVRYRSYVHGTRVFVSRRDLAQAIGLPTKKEIANAFLDKDSMQDLVSADGAIRVLQDFMSNYMLFEEDKCILFPEVIQAIQFVKEGVAYKVDWPSVMWVLVERELLDAPKTKTCFYATHLQCLIEHQHPVLFSKKLEPVLPPDAETGKPEVKHPPEILESGGRGDEGGGVEEVIAKDKSSLSNSPPSVSLPYLASPRNSAKKGTGRRKKKPLKERLREAERQREAAAKHRLELLNEKFLPVPFSPGKALDISAHEELFHAVGLWKFSHLDLGRELQPDLLADLIAYYDPERYCSYVHGTRVLVSRRALADAIGLPTKKEKANAFLDKDYIQDLVSADGAIQVLLDFVSNYMLFEEDMCILPSEVIQAIQFVKEGVAYKVDWPSVMWVLVEKELLEAPKTRTCFYATHLQCLIEHQHPVLFSKKLEPVLSPHPETEEEERVSVAYDVNVEEVKINAVGELPLAEEEADADNRKMRSLEDLVKVASERHNSEFGLTLEESVMNDEESQWLEEGENKGLGQCMRRCTSKAIDSIDFENFTKVDEEEKQEKSFANDLSVKYSNMEMMTSSDHLEMENANIPFTRQENHLNPSSGVLVDTGPDSHKNVILDHGSTASIYFGNNGKRKVDEILHEQGQFDSKNPLKVMRSREPWGNLHPFSFDECIYQIHCGLKRANTLFVEKDQGVVSMEMEVQYLNQLLQEKDREIQSLELAMEGQKNWQMAMREYEVELCMVSQLMLGYKKALKETRSRFADYRKMHPHDEESLYKDVPGEDGLVLSVREFEKYRLMQEEKKRQELLRTLGCFKQILNKLEECEGCIKMHDTKLGMLVGEMKQLKEGFVRSSCSDK